MLRVRVVRSWLRGGGVVGEGRVVGARGRLRLGAVGWVVVVAVLAGVVAPAPGAARGVSGEGVAIGVPWAIGGERIERDGSRVWFPGEWPGVPVSVVRVWDARTAWLNIEPQRGRFDFERLDAFVGLAERRGASVMLVLGGTPRWAAREVRASDAPWLGPGSASPPAEMGQWRRFVSAVAERYAGRIDAYEVWNEPNSLTFWSGTPQEYGQVVRVAVAAIRAADPGARVLASGFTVGDVRGVARLAPWVAALGESGARVDAVSVHWYPRAGSDPLAVRGAVGRLRGLAARSGLAGVPVAVTEVNVRGGSALSAAQQRRWVTVLHDELDGLGVSPVVWYAWTDLGPPDLIAFHPGTPGARALAVLSRRTLVPSACPSWSPGPGSRCRSGAKCGQWDYMHAGRQGVGELSACHDR